LALREECGAAEVLERGEDAMQMGHQIPGWRP